MELPLINSKNKTLQVPDSLFNQEVNDNLITQLINSFIDNGHQGTKAQKNRSQVSGVGKNLGGKRGLEEQELAHQEVQFGEEAELLLPQNLNLQVQKK